MVSIYAASPHDSFRINGMGLVYLEHGLTLCQTDALSIHDNFIAECGSCIELRRWGQASKITDNLLGAKESKPLGATHVLVEPEATQNTVAD